MTWGLVFEVLIPGQIKNNQTSQTENGNCQVLWVANGLCKLGACSTLPTQGRQGQVRKDRGDDSTMSRGLWCEWRSGGTCAHPERNPRWDAQVQNFKFKASLYSVRRCIQGLGGGEESWVKAG